MGRVVSEVEWERRQELLERLASSGLSMAEFARREEVSYSQLLAWRAKFRAPSAPPSGGFAELVVERAAPVRPGCAVEVALPSGATICLYNGADAELARAVLGEAFRC